MKPGVDAGVKELNEMTIGRTDDPENLFGAPAFEAAEVFGFGSRIPSRPAVMEPRPQGRTHDRNRPARQNSHFSFCVRGGRPHMHQRRCRQLFGISWPWPSWEEIPGAALVVSGLDNLRHQPIAPCARRAPPRAICVRDKGSGQADVSTETASRRAT
jgi:hypothetical protein